MSYRVDIDGLTPPPETVRFKVSVLIVTTDPIKAAVIAGAILHKKIGHYMVRTINMERVEDLRSVQVEEPVDDPPRT